MSIDSRSVFILAGILTLAFTPSAQGFAPADRWSTTASGPTGAAGDPITLTWSFVPDGTNIPNNGASNLISFLDSNFGSGPGGSDFTKRPWFQFFDDSLDRWSQLGGITYVYEPNDDGVSHGLFPGVLNVRGDLRFGAVPIDGSSGTLAFSGLPNSGDMALDSDDGAFFSNPEGNQLRLRNTIMHELGHGFGLNHVESNTDNFLLEPFISTAFDGPQFDDIRGIQWFYGDVLEKSNGGLGNDSAAFATDLGAIAAGGMTSIGADAGPDTATSPLDVDYVSIDRNTDVDFFSFTVSEPSTLDVLLTPLGATFNQGVQGGSQTPIDTSSISDLALSVFDTNGTSLLASANNVGAGQVESLSEISLPVGGEYFVRITGTDEIVQFYQLELAVNSAASLFVGDYNGNGVVDAADYTVWRDTLGQTVASGTGADGSGNGIVGQEDYDFWKNNFGAVANVGASFAIQPTAVPEPKSEMLLIIGGFLVTAYLFSRQQRTCSSQASLGGP